MKKPISIVSFLLGLSILLTGCMPAATEPTAFYDKVIEDFGVLKNVTPYTVNSSVSALDENAVRYHGRYYRDTPNQAVWFSYTNAGFEVTFEGTTLEGDFLATRADDMQNKPYIAVSVDGDYDPDHAAAIQFSSVGQYDNSTETKNGVSKHEHVVLAHGLSDSVHTVRIYKRSECQNSRLALVRLSTDGEICPTVQAKELSLKMEVYGDSVTCGYAVESDDFYENFTTRTENGMKTYANYAANLLNGDISCISAGGYPLYRSIYSEHNNPSTVPQMFSMAEFEYQTSFTHNWDNKKYIPDVVVIALGANDGSILSQYEVNGRAYNEFVANFEREYCAFIDKIYKTYPDTLIVVSDEIVDMGEVFRNIADEIVEKYKQDGKRIVRAKYDAYDLAEDRTLPGAGHPNGEMQKIAGYELARIIADELDLSLVEDDFMTRYQ